MVAYNLTHLTQAESQEVVGPIQDDEALFLYSLTRVMRLKRILEIGALGGYSARNFCAAVGNDGAVYSVDINPIPKLAKNHFPIHKDARLLSSADVGGKPLDLVFFDCHIYDVQLALFHQLGADGVITETTVLVLHDTNLHPKQFAPWPYKIEEGWVHQPVERRMVNEFKRLGYDAFVLDTQMQSHGPDLPYRHGVTVMRKFKPLAV